MDFDVERAKDAVREVDGNFVLISDKSYFDGEYLFCKIKFDESDTQSYSVQFPVGCIRPDKEKGVFRKVQLYYHDLQSLIKLGNIRVGYRDYVKEF